MKKLLFFALFVFAAWYGWKHYRALIDHRPSHEAVVQNDGTVDLERVRLTVDGQTFVKEVVPSGGSVTFPFRVNDDATFRLVFQRTGKLGEREWTGGMVPKGPMVQRHIISVDDNGDVMYRAENR
jgi:hypothetical protein